MTFIIEMVMIAIMAVLIVTQLILPLCGYGRYFWIFRKEERELSDINEDIEEIKLKEKVVEAETYKQEQAERLKKEKGETQNAEHMESRSEQDTKVYNEENSSR
jgi:hypothetical protein